MLRLAQRMARLVALLLVFLLTTVAWAAMPNPLENAYWRFEEDQAAGTPVGPPDTDVVLDSGNNNDARALAPDMSGHNKAPVYTSAVAPTPLRTGHTNNGALEFRAADLDEIAVPATHNIGNPTFPDGVGMTIEAAFRPTSVNFPGGTYQAIVSRDRSPNSGLLPTLTLKIRGDSGKLQLEQFDASKTVRSVSTLSPLAPNEWYYAAAVNNGSLLSLYLDRNDGNGYQLEDSVAVQGVMYQGSAPDGWPATWAIGRGWHNGGSTDWFDGIIDEVRITNTALDPSQFLFAPLQGDFNHNGVVDGADYVVWRKGLNVDFQPDDYNEWREHFGETAVDFPGSGAGAGAMATAVVPEAAGGMMLLTALAANLCGRRACRRRM